MGLITSLRGLLQRRRAEREMDDELAFHLEMEAQANVARGMTPAGARQAALSAFGGVAQAKENIREVRTLRIESLWQDVRHGLRVLAAQPRVTLAAAGMLALAIGLTTAMFTIVDALVIRPVPFRDPGQLAHLWMGTDRGGVTSVPPAVLSAWRESPAFEAAESASSREALLEFGDIVVTRGLATVTPGVFDMLGGVRPVRGRLFVATEGRPGESDRVLVSEAVWRTLFDADPALVGRTVAVDGERLTVVGILPDDFRFPSVDTVLWRPTDLGRPAERASAYVRFVRGVRRDDALRLATVAARAADAATSELRARVSPLVYRDDSYARRAVPLLAGGGALVFMVLSANVCSLLLARMTSRRREFSMRAALGASRGRLLTHALAESAVLGLLGIAAGAAIAAVLVSIARALLPEPILRQTLNPLSLDERAIAATCVSGFAAVLAAGLLPAWLGTRVGAGDSMRIVERSGTETRGTRALTRGLLVVEVAFACTLLVGATLLARSFVNLARADRGLDTSGVTTLWLALPATSASDAAAREAMTRTIEDALRGLPGVRRVAWSYGLPPRGGMLSFGEWISDVPGAPSVDAEVDRYVVSPEFFTLYGIPIVSGRSFDAADSWRAVIVSERWARVLWPDVDPIGRTFRFDKEQFEVIGVAREIHYPSIDSSLDGPEFYHRYNAVGTTPMVSVRCERGCPDPALIRHRLASTHPAVRVQDARPLELAYAAQIARPRAAAALAAVFALVALVAAAGGLFSVLSYSVSRRRREFGIHSALGASARQVRGVVLRDALVVGTGGLVIGALLAAGFARALASLQYGVTPGDPLSWCVVLGLIAATIGLASWGPARAAATVDPLVLLRED